MTSLDKILNYNILQSQGLIVQKREIEFLADRAQYRENDNVRIRFNLGDKDFVYGPGCKLSFNLQYAGDLNPNRQNEVATKQPNTALGNNVFSLLVRNLRILNDRVELEDIRDVDQISHTLSDLCSLRFKQTHGQTMGMADPQYLAGDLDQTFAAEGFQTRFVEARETKDNLLDLDQSVTIPCHFMSNLFGKEHLLPMGLFGTGETLIEMKLKPAAEAAIWQLGININYTISDMKLHLDVYTLSEQLFSEVKSIMSSTGLEMSFMTWDHTEQLDGPSAMVGAGGGQTRKIEMFRGVKRATKLMAFITGADNTADNRDSLSRYSYSVIDQYLFRVGSDRIPMNTFIETAAEGYTSSLMACNLLDSCDDAPALSFNEYQSDRHFLAATLTRDPGMVPDGAMGTETASNRRISLEITLNDRPVDKVANNDRRASGQFILNLWVGFMRNLKITEGGTIKVE